MINLQHLRLGNWILPNDKKLWTPDFNFKPVRLDTSLLMFNILEKDNSSSFDYIPITKKLLEKFGCYGRNKKAKNILSFEIIGTSIIELLQNRKDTFSVFIRQPDSERIDREDDLVMLFNDISYLHQLQNIFYCITGIELNDIVAYNYYLLLHKKFIGISITSQNNAMDFNAFIFTIQNIERLTKDWFGLPNYNLGDLPKNLFEL